MKFIYVDESGGRDQGDIFTMCGLMVDANKMRKKTADLDAKLPGPGEEQYYAGLVEKLEQQREKIGRCPDTPGVRLFNQAKHEGWKL